MKKYKTTIISFSILLICVFSLLAFLWFQHPVRIVVENDSKEIVNDISINVGKHAINFGEIKPKEQKNEWIFYKNSDSSFQIKAKTKSGKLVNKKFGYITHSPGFERVYFKLKENGEINYKYK